MDVTRTGGIRKKEKRYTTLSVIHHHPLPAWRGIIRTFPLPYTIGLPSFRLSFTCISCHSARCVVHCVSVEAQIAHTLSSACLAQLDTHYKVIREGISSGWRCWYRRISSGSGGYRRKWRRGRGCKTWKGVLASVLCERR